VGTDPGRIVRADREVVAVTLRREAGLVTRRGHTAVVGAMVSLSGLVDRRETAEARYARVLDGRTLNLLVALPARAGSATVVLARGRVRERIPATLSEDGDSAEAVAPLGGLGLAAGRWRILLALTSPDGREETYAVRNADPGRDGGPTLDAPPCPDTGYRYAVGRSPAGALVITVVPPAPAAELTGLRAHPTGLRLTGRLVGVGDATGTVIVFTGPDRREHRVPALVRETGFEAAVPVASLADGPTERAWKVWAEVPAGGRLRVGRFLTDLRSVQAAYRRPNRMVRLEGRAYAMVRASYAAGGGLTLVCTAGKAEQ
jgi:hypothetical protein